MSSVVSVILQEGEREREMKNIHNMVIECVSRYICIHMNSFMQKSEPRRNFRLLAKNDKFFAVSFP